MVRFLLLFLILIAAIRLSGKAQVHTQSRIQLAAFVSLAAAIGIPMQVPDRSIVPALIIAMVVVGLQRLFSRWAFSSPRVANALHGNYGMLVKDGVFQLKDMHNIGLSRERVVASLREKGLPHLGVVERLYMEAGGNFTIIQQKDPRPGLSLIPLWDTEFREQQTKASAIHVCTNCGSPQSAGKQTCPVCGENRWEPGVL